MRNKLSDDVFDPEAPRGVPIRYLHDGCSKRGDKTLVITRVEDGWAFNCHRCGLCGVRGLDGFGGSVVAKFARAHFKPLELVVEKLTLPPKALKPDPIIVNKADTWLMSFGITAEERDELSVYLDCSDRLVIPVYSSPCNFIDCELIYWQSRGFKQNEPKWINQRAAGRDNVYFKVAFISGLVELGTVCLVEDILSAVKVGRVCPTIGLLGSYIPDKLILDLTKTFRCIILWLDFDKRNYVINKIKRFREFGLPVRGIFTKADPKKQSMEVIEQCINLE